MSTPSIVSTARTAVGSFNDAFGNTPAHELGAAVIKAVLERAGVEASEVDDVILGHPIGASGACVLNTLLFEMKRRGVSTGLATLCVGGGMGVAMCVEAM
jgi:acetyl-CoA acetyltransferase